jgi:hypothetical protein
MAVKGMMNNRDLEIKMNRFNQMCNTIRGSLNNNTRKDSQIKICKAMEPTLTYGSKTWTVTRNRKQKLNLRK